MSEAPPPLFLTAIAIIGTALASFIHVGNTPIVILIIPIAVAGAWYYGFKEGMGIAVGAGIFSALFLETMGNWEWVAIVLGGLTSVYVYHWFSNAKDNKEWYALLAVLLGSVAFEIGNDIILGRSLLLQDSIFLGSAADAGLRIIINGVILLGLISFWEKKEK